jgi:predicted CoA-binding protein
MEFPRCLGWCSAQEKYNNAIISYYIIGNLTFVHGVTIITGLYPSTILPLSNFYGLTMQSIEELGNNLEITKLLEEVGSIAIVGLSVKESRPSNMVARYLIEAGYTVFPVNPGQSEILGLPCYPDLASIPERIDIVDIFRRSEDIPPIVAQSVNLVPLPRAIWMQQGIVNQQAAELARKRGIYVVMDRCIKVDHANLLR